MIAHVLKEEGVTAAGAALAVGADYRDRDAALGAGACYIEWRALVASFSPFEAIAWPGGGGGGAQAPASFAA